jgi:hypothetical protein
MTDDSNVVRLNQKVHSNLDEAERDSTYETFAFVLNGQRVEMVDPREIEFKDLMTIEHPANFLKFALSPEAKKLLAETDLPGWKFNKLIHDYMDHYGLDPATVGKGSLFS